MNSHSFNIRRATVEDLPQLRNLWQDYRFQVSDLEKRLTEFQVVINEKTELIGAVALHISGQHGLIHSEAFAHPELQDTLRPQLWERLVRLGQNHCLARFWTLETTPFWRRYAGFRTLLPGELDQLPPAFGERNADWLTLRLREEGYHSATVEQNLNLFRKSQKEDTENIMRQVRKIKTIVAWTAIVFFLSILLISVYVLVKTPWLSGR